MPGYGVVGPEQGSGLMPWAVAEEQLAGSRNYWLASVWPDGRPHAMPVWGVWHDRALWFSSSAQSRKVRNLAADPRCVLATEDADNPVVLEGVAEVRTSLEDRSSYLALMNAKYSTAYPLDLLDPAVSATVRVRPRWVFSLNQDDFTGSPTRWVFDTP
jgi:PPOX class probable F420-dependent enzyme